MDEKFHVYHTFAENETELEPMRRSKYVESELGEAYPKVKKLLEERYCSQERRVRLPV